MKKFVTVFSLLLTGVTFADTPQIRGTCSVVQNLKWNGNRPEIDETAVDFARRPCGEDNQELCQKAELAFGVTTRTTLTAITPTGPQTIVLDNTGTFQERVLTAEVQTQISFSEGAPRLLANLRAQAAAIFRRTNLCPRTATP